MGIWLRSFAVILLMTVAVRHAYSEDCHVGSLKRITLRNGDVVTGFVAAEGTESLTLCSLVLGTISIPRAAVNTVVAVNADSPAPKQSARKLEWVLGLNAPASLAFGTTSQEGFTPAMSVDVFDGQSSQATVAASGSHSRSWGIGSPSIFTDTFHGFLKHRQSLGRDRGSVFGRADWFFNTSLGMALQQSFGAGYQASGWKVGPFQLEASADLRYFSERLYGQRRVLALAGSRFEGQINYRGKDPKDSTKTKYSITWIASMTPMWNDENARQAFSSLQISVPFGRSVCLGITPLEDDYMHNAPPGHKRNYLTSSVALQIRRGSSPNFGCY